MHPVFNHVVADRYLLPTVYLSVTDIANSDLFTGGCRTCISLDIARFYEEQCQPSRVSAWPACPKTVNWSAIDGGRRGRQFTHKLLYIYTQRIEKITVQ